MLAAFALAAAQVSAGAPLPTVAVSSAPTEIVFRPVSGTMATLVVRSGGTSQTTEIKSLSEALALLADKRLISIWPQITEWAGPGLEKLRDNAIDASRIAFAKRRTKDADTTLGSLVSPKLRGTVLLADALLNAGRINEAVGLMEKARGTAPRQGMWGPVEWGATSIWLAEIQYIQGNVQAAIGILEASIPALGNDRSKLNLELTRAAMLLDVNRAGEALTAANTVQASFAAPGGDGPFSTNARVRGSDRQFALVTSCALSKLGRTTEAAAAASPLHTGVEPLEKRYIIAPTIKLRTRWARCTGDVAAAAQAYADALAAEPVGGDALLELQPSLALPTFDQTFLEKVRQHPILALLLAERWRPLPEDLVPALNGWRTASAAQSPTSASNNQ